MRRVLLAVAVLLLVSGTAFANCGSEGCPLQPFGPERLYGRWTFDLGYQSINQDKLWDGSAESGGTEGVGHITERVTDTQSWVGTLGFTISPRLQVQAVVPYLDRRHAHDLEHHAGAFVTYEWQYQGPGDASVLGNWRATGDPTRGIGSLTVQAGIKLPTGSTDVEEIDGEAPEPPARLGTGSTDGLLGVTLGHAFDVPALGGRHDLLPIGVAILGRVNGVGTEGYRVGNEVMANLTASYPVVHWASLLFQVNGVMHARDEVGDTDAEPHETGSETLYLTPGANVHWQGVGAYAYWQVRTYAHTNGPQLVAPSHFIFGMSYALH